MTALDELQALVDAVEERLEWLRASRSPGGLADADFPTVCREAIPALDALRAALTAAGKVTEE